MCRRYSYPPDCLNICLRMAYESQSSTPLPGIKTSVFYVYIFYQNRSNLRIKKPFMIYLYWYFTLFCCCCCSPEDSFKVGEQLRQADAIVLMYACDRRETLERLSSFWLPRLRNLGVLFSPLFSIYTAFVLRKCLHDIVIWT